MSKLTDLILPDESIHLAGLFNERVKRSATKPAYLYFNKDTELWQHYTWEETRNKIAKIQQVFLSLALEKGERIGIMAENCPEWIMFEQAGLALGLVIVPLYPNDRAENVKYILNDAEIKVLLVSDDSQCCLLNDISADIENVKLIISLHSSPEKDNYRNFDDIINTSPTSNYSIEDIRSEELASIVYTSGTTGRPKGVMLSHANILQNAYGASQCESFLPGDTYLSFLPLSHMFERTVGYYLPMMSGGTVAYARSIENLAADLINIKPTILVTVPRIFERVYNKIKLQLQNKPKISRYIFDLTVDIGWHWFLYSQNRASWHFKLLLRPLLYSLVSSKILKKLGGNLRLAISGGAALSPEIARIFIGLGLKISQGYGMTEASPVVCTNLLHDNIPSSVGQRLLNVDVSLGENNELLVKGPNVMMGYLNNPDATNKSIDKDGWLHTGDKAKIINEHIYITGRIKDILVLSNGEKVSPSDIELAISNDTLIDQVIIYGENKPYLTAILSLNHSEWSTIQTNIFSNKSIDINSTDAHEYILGKVKKCLYNFPGYARIYKIYCTMDAWTVENGLTTPTLKLKRKYIFDKYQKHIDEMYKGH